MRPWFDALLSLLLLGGMFYFMPSKVMTGWFGPLLTIVPVTIALRGWLRSPIRFGIIVYGLSIITGIVAMEGFGMSDEASAELAGFYLPPVYLLALCALTALEKAGFSALSLAPKGVLGRVFGALGGALVGCLVGALFGGVSYYILNITQLLEHLVGYDRGLELWVQATMAVAALYGLYLGLTGMEDEEGVQRIRNLFSKDDAPPAP